MRFVSITLVSAYFSLYGASSALAALHVNKHYRLCARFKRGNRSCVEKQLKLGPIFQTKKSNRFTKHSLTIKNQIDYFYSCLMLLSDLDSLQSPSSHPSFLCFANENVKQTFHVAPVKVVSLFIYSFILGLYNNVLCILLCNAIYTKNITMSYLIA